MRHEGVVFKELLVSLLADGIEVFVAVGCKCLLFSLADVIRLKAGAVVLRVVAALAKRSKYRLVCLCRCSCARFPDGFKRLGEDVLLRLTPESGVFPYKVGNRLLDVPDKPFRLGFLFLHVYLLVPCQAENRLAVPRRHGHENHVCAKILDP